MDSSFLFLLPKSHSWSWKPLSVISPTEQIGKVRCRPCSEARKSMEENWEQKQLGGCAKAEGLLCVLKALSWMPAAVPVFPYAQLSQHETRPATMPVLTRHGKTIGTHTHSLHSFSRPVGCREEGEPWTQSQSLLYQLPCARPTVCQSFRNVQEDENAILSTPFYRRGD